MRTQDKHLSKEGPALTGLRSAAVLGPERWRGLRASPDVFALWVWWINEASHPDSRHVDGDGRNSLLISFRCHLVQDAVVRPGVLEQRACRC